MLLAALLDLGAPAPAVQQDLDALGEGDSRMSWVRMQRGGTPALVASVRAPIGTAMVTAPNDSLDVLAAAVLDPEVVRCATGVLGVLHRAMADVDGVDVADLVLAPVPALDDLALAVAIASALVRLRITSATLLGPVAIGSSDDPAGDPVATALLSTIPTRVRTGATPAPTDAMAAAWLVVLGATETGASDDPIRVGRGAQAGATDDVLRLLLHAIEWTTP